MDEHGEMVDLGMQWQEERDAAIAALLAECKRAADLIERLIREDDYQPINSAGEAAEILREAIQKFEDE